MKKSFNTSNHSGFSLMEMMIVLLIVAIVAAAAAPMVTKKMSRGAGISDSPWVFTGNNDSITFNPSGDDKNYVIIGASKYNKGTLGPENPRLVLAGGKGLVFADDKGKCNSILSVSNSTVIMGNSNAGANSVAIGMGQEISASDAIAIGYGAKVIVPGAKAYSGISTHAGASSPKRSPRKVPSGATIDEKPDGPIEGCDPVLPYDPLEPNYDFDDGDDDGDKIPQSENITGNIAIGEGATINLSASAQEDAASIVIGKNASTGVNGTVVIGDNARAVGFNDAVAIGRKVVARGEKAIAIGYEAGAYAKNSIAIGNDATAQHIADDAQSSIAIGNAANALGNNSVAIGNGARAAENNQITLGTASDHVDIPGDLIVSGNLEVYGGIIHHETSDRRLKNVGERFTAGLAELNKLDVYNYTFKKDKENTPRVGVMAQDLQKVFPNAVIKGNDGFLRIRMEDMFYAMINAIKELNAKVCEVVKNITDINAKIDTQQKIIEEQQKTIKELQAQNAEFEKRLTKLENNKCKK